MAGKSMKPGGGGRFMKLEKKIEGEGKSAGEAKAIAASAGRKKFGKKKMMNFAEEGERRAARSRGRSPSSA